MTFKILTDSTSDLDEKWAQEHNVDIIGLTIELDGKTYETVGDEKITSDFLLERMQEGAKPTTSQINVGQFEEVFSTYAENDHALLYLALSSHLSGTYQSATIAREMVLDKYPDAQIEIVDTMAASCGEGVLAMLATKERQEGKSLEEVKQKIESLLPKLNTYFLVDDLNHLMRSGRLSKGADIIGSVAKIKPLLKLDSEGKLVPFAKTRGRKKGIKEIVTQATKTLSYSTLIIAYSGEKDSAQVMKEQLLADERIEEVIIRPLGPVISAHVGSGALALFSLGEENR